MRDRPNGAELLDIAGKRLIEELLPVLPAENKYSAHLVAAAMAIAMRELENGDAAETEEQIMLSDLLGAEGLSLLDLNRRFAAGVESVPMCVSRLGAATIERNMTSRSSP